MPSKDFEFKSSKYNEEFELPVAFTDGDMEFNSFYTEARREYENDVFRDMYLGTW